MINKQNVTNKSDQIDLRAYRGLMGKKWPTAYDSYTWFNDGYTDHSKSEKTRFFVKQTESGRTSGR